MIPGTRPARRSALAVPLPASERDAALIRLTVAMMNPCRLSPKGALGLPRQPPGVPKALKDGRGGALIAARSQKNKEGDNTLLNCVGSRRAKQQPMGHAADWLRRAALRAPRSGLSAFRSLGERAAPCP